MHERSKRRLFAGIDGGQSSTRAVVADESGTILGRGTSGPCDEIGEPAGSRRLADAVEGALEAALRDAGFDLETELESVVAALSGYEGTLTGVAPRVRASHVRLIHDAPAALAGAIRGPGIALICGTGSVAYGEDALERTARAGGWGYVFGDRGSTFWIARSALTEAMRAFDAGVSSALGALALAHFNEPNMRALARAFYAGTISRAQLAGFAELVGAAALDGEPRAKAIVDHAGMALTKLALRVKRRLDFGMRVRIALCGGGFAEEGLRSATERALRAHPDIEVMVPDASPTIGALRLAYRATGTVAGAGATSE